MNEHIVMPKSKQEVTRKSKNARTRAQHAALIKEAWQSTLDGIFHTGVRLETAKAELAHGEWLLLIANDLPFAENTAQRLMKIADDERLRNTAHAPYLPVARETLYELTKVDDETFEAAIEDGRINPKMERKDALALRPGRPRKAGKSKKRSTDPHRLTACMLDVKGRVNEIFDELDQSDRDDLLQMLAGFLESLRKVKPREE